MSRAAIFAVAAVVCATPASADVGYFAAIDDLPMPPGFAEGEAGGSFTSPGGRIVLASAEGRLEPMAVRDFYYEALPQLGWSASPQSDGSLVFVRGRERLSFTIERSDRRTRLGAQLVILPASTAD